MANTSELVKLFTAIAGDDSGLMKKIAAQIAEAEFKRGKTSLARMLISALEPTKSRSDSNLEFTFKHFEHGSFREAENTTSSPLGVLNQFLKKLETAQNLSTLFAPKRTKEELVSIIEEQVAKAELRANGLAPRNKVLLYGPPGCGKTLAATALGNELGLPVYLVQFDALIGSYLGQTAQNLRQLFDFAVRIPSVILIDEVDAIAFQRGNPNDVGELNRIVISFMQHLEHFSPAGLIVCSTNLIDALDPALRRRFDISIQFPAPKTVEKKSFSQSVSKRYRVGNSASFVKGAKSYAEIESRVKAEARRKVVASNRKGEG